jgi:hypothetical protein
VSVHRMYRVTVFVPPESVHSLLETVSREAPLTYGRYDRCACFGRTREYRGNSTSSTDVHARPVVSRRFLLAWP